MVMVVMMVLVIVMVMMVMARLLDDLRAKGELWQLGQEAERAPMVSGYCHRLYCHQCKYQNHQNPQHHYHRQWYQIKTTNKQTNVMLSPSPKDDDDDDEVKVHRRPIS